MGEYTPQSRSEEILYDTIHSLEYTERPQSRIEELLLELKAVIEAGSGTSNYEELEHLPKINSVELKGNKSLADLGAASEEAVAEKASQSDIAPTFSDATAYTAGDVVYHDGSLYRFTADHAAGAWDSADVESVTVDDLVDGLKPVDSITNGDMRPVTSNAVADALALKADLPVDAVTNGSMKAVTSNAVYDAMATESVNVGTITANSGETANLSIRKTGKVVQLRLSSLTTTGNAHSVIFSGVIPKGYRPSIETLAYGRYVSSTRYVDTGGSITTDGDIMLYSYSQFNNGIICANYITT